MAQFPLGQLPAALGTIPKPYWGCFAGATSPCNIALKAGKCLI